MLIAQGFARGMVRQQEIVRNTLLDGVKAAKKAEKVSQSITYYRFFLPPRVI